MKTGKRKYNIYKYSDFYFEEFFCNEIDYTSFLPEHLLILIYSGELSIIDGNEKLFIKKGEYVFIRRNDLDVIIKNNDKNEKFRSICMGFSHSFLYRFYMQMDNKNSFSKDNKFNTNILKLPQTPFLQSLFLSMIPYFDWEVKPCKEIMELKLEEAVHCLLMTNNKFKSCLFDFNTTEKKDIMDFLDKNYMYDMTIDLIAAFTGRSTSTFNRHFKKINRLTPYRWLMQKRLEKASERILKGEDIKKIYAELGFRNIKQFKNACKKKDEFHQ